MYTLARSSPFLIFLGALCYYLALPPVNFAPLALAVPICWGIVIRKPAVCRLSSAVYLSAFLFWLASIWWIACPHPLTSLGLIALSTFLSLYWLLFFVSARVAVRYFRIPLLIAMPLCWIGTEYLRCHLLGGFSFCSLEHAFYLYPMLIEFATFGGGMLVGGFIMLIGSAFITPFYISKWRFKIGYIIFVLFPVLFLLMQSIEQSVANFYSLYFAKGTASYSIVTLQGNRQVYLSDSQEAAADNFRQFVRLTYDTVAELKKEEKPLPDLIVFPETVCHIPILKFEGSVKPADIGITDEETTDWERQFQKFADQIETPILLGLSTLIFKGDPENPARLNSALLVQPTLPNPPIPPDSCLLTPDSSLYRYDKMHLVMFGEYIPFTEYLPNDFFLKTLCVEAQSGSKPVAMPIGQGRGETTDDRRQTAEEGRQATGGRRQQIWASVNICFESTVAHLIRSQILTLRKEGHDPRVLINMSNDGWFRNSHQMEQHLATHVFRAVENRMWYITATNGGFSAIIDPFGTIQKIGKRCEAEAVSGEIFVNMGKPHSLTIYQKYGDWYALPFALGVLFLTGLHSFGKRRLKETNRM